MADAINGKWINGIWVVLTPEVVRQLLNQGLTQSDIARWYGCTRANVSHIVRKYSIPLPLRRKTLEDHFPWKVPTDQQQQAPYKRMCDHAEWYVTDGYGMSDTKLKRVAGFHRMLRDGDLVVEFDPELPPIPDVANKGGFAYRKRLKRDKGLMLRVNEHTRLTDVGWDMWRLPAADL